MRSVGEDTTWGAKGDLREIERGCAGGRGVFTLKLLEQGPGGAADSRPLHGAGRVGAQRDGTTGTDGFHSRVIIHSLRSTEDDSQAAAAMEDGLTPTALTENGPAVMEDCTVAAAATGTGLTATTGTKVGSVDLTNRQRGWFRA